MNRTFSFSRKPRIWIALFIGFWGVSQSESVSSQGIHFSQYYNSPMFANAANTGLMPDNEYRVGANYRTQWGAVPVPFHTFSVSGDAQVLRKKNETNWMGLGGAAFTDKGGDGNLSMARFDAYLAYHILLNKRNMISFGASLGYVQRSVDFSKLSFDAQWDGFDFDQKMSNNEIGIVNKTNYADLGAGLNYAYFPSENFYLKIGAGLTHINQPRETFMNQSNKVGMRPTVNVDASIKTSDKLIVNPSIYYTTQKGAMELMYGGLLNYRVNEDPRAPKLILGAYHRWNDAIVGAFGIDWHNLRIMGSYDFTVSGLGQYISHDGAMEFGITWKGNYKDNGTKVRAYQCPRF